MAVLRILCRTLVFLLQLQFPPGKSIADINGTYPSHNTSTAAVVFNFIQVSSDIPILFGGLVLPAIHAREDANCAAPPTVSIENNPFPLVKFVGEPPALVPAALHLKEIAVIKR